MSVDTPAVNDTATPVLQPSLSFTRFTSRKPARLSKHFALVGNVLDKQSGGNMTAGMAEKVTVTLAGFAAMLPTLKPNQATCYGIAGHDAARVVMRDAVTQASNGDMPVIARTRDYFAWPAGAGMMMLDYDAPPERPALDKAALREALVMACPPLNSAPAIWRPSASSCIGIKGGAELRGIAGQRLYIPVLDASDIERAGQVLFDRLWLAGYGRYELSKSGALLLRAPIDARVFQPERLDFCGGASLGAGLEQHLPPPDVFNPDAPYLDTRAALPDLDDEEVARLAELRESLKTPELLERQKQVKEQWIKARVDERQATMPEPAKEAARPKLEATYRQALEGGWLAPDFELTVKPKGGKAARRITVADALAQKDKYHEATCLDPFEPDYPDGDGRFVGWLNLKHKPPYITSQAHGGIQYFLGVAPAAESGPTGSFKPAPDDEPPDEAGLKLPTVSPCTHLANSHRIRHYFKGRIWYALGVGWILWTGKFWRPDPTKDGAIATGFVDGLSRRIATEAGIITRKASEESDSDQRKTLMLQGEALMKWAVQSENERVIASGLKLTKHALLMEYEALNADPWLFNCQNGTIDLRTGSIRPHNPADLITFLSPVVYDPAATCSVWLQFLADVFADDQEMVAFIQRAVGWSLSGVVKERALFFLYGNSGKNGKTTMVEAIMKLVGMSGETSYGYGRKVGADTFMKSRNQEDNQRKAATLAGPRFVCTSEVDEEHRLNEQLVKDITGGDTLEGRRLYQEAFTFKPQFKPWMYGNHKPEIRGTDDAMWSRVRMIPFDVSFKGREDLELANKLEAELSGILNWAIQGCLAWQRTGLQPPAKIEAATQAYRDEMDVFGPFIAECCVVHKNSVR